MHIGYFRGIADAEQVRDVMLQRLREAKDSGLGEGDEVQRAAAPARAGPGPASSERFVSALQVVVDEARALRRAAARL